MPQILFGKQDFYFDEDDCPIRIGSAKGLPICLPDTHNIAPEHLEILYANDKFYVRNISNIEVFSKNGFVLKPGGSGILGEQNFFIFGNPGSGNEVFLAYNSSNEVRFENIEIPKDHLQNEAEILVGKFYADINISNIGAYLVYFLSRNFHITTAMIVLNQVNVNRCSKWISSSEWRRDPSRRYRPSMKLLKQFVATGKPVKFDITEEEESTFSIVSNKIKKAFFFPLSLNDRVFGALYIDTQDTVLSETDFYKISYLLGNGVAAILKLSLENKEKSEIKSDRPLCDDLRGLPFSVKILCDKHKFLVLSHRSYESNHRFIMVDAKDMEHAVRIKNFIDGLQRGNWNMDTVVHYSKLVSEYSSLASCDISIEPEQDMLKISLNKSDLHVGMKMVKENIIIPVEEQDFDYFEIGKNSILYVSPNDNFQEDRLEISM